MCSPVSLTLNSTAYPHLVRPPVFRSRRAIYYSGTECNSCLCDICVTCVRGKSVNFLSVLTSRCTQSWIKCLLLLRHAHFHHPQLCPLVHVSFSRRFALFSPSSSLSLINVMFVFLPRVYSSCLLSLCIISHPVSRSTLFLFWINSSFFLF